MRVRPSSLALLVVLLLAGCGGSGGDGSTAPQTGSTAATALPAATAYVKPAERVCSRMLRETRELGRRFVDEVAASPSRDLAGSATDGLIKPGLRVLDRVGARLRAIEARYPSPAFSAYVGLYEPLLQLGRLRLAAAEAGDIAESRNLEAQMEAVGAEQRVAARLAGLHSCRIDFLHALVVSWSER